MHRSFVFVCAGLLALGSCAGLSDAPSEPSWRRSRDWPHGQPLLQGFFGVQRLESFEREGGLVEDVEQDGRPVYPVLGGGAQWKLAGQELDLGLEGLLAIGWRPRGGGLSAGPGGSTIAVDVNVLAFDLFGGPFVSAFLADGLRAYAGAGPLMQYVEYDQKTVPSGELGEDFDRSTTGFGVGWYARAGIEFLITPASWLGLGARWADSTVDLGRGMGELDLEGFQIVVTLANF